MPKDPSFDYYLDQQINEHMTPDPEEEEEEEYDNLEEEEEEEKRARIIEAAKAALPRFKAYCKEKNLKIVDNKLVPCEDEDG